MTSRHEYGPHQPENAPNAVTVLSPARHSCGWERGHAASCTVTSYPQPEVRPLPEVLVRQRQLRDDLAAERARQRRLEELRELQRHAWPCSCGLWHPHLELCPDGGWHA